MYYWYRKIPVAGIFLNYDDGEYNQGYHQMKEAFQALTKDDILQPYNSEQDFRSSNVRDNVVVYNLYVFDKRYRKYFLASHPIKVEFEFDGVVPKDINGYALVLKNKLVAKSSDGQRHFELIKAIFKYFILLSSSFIVNSVFFSKASL